MEKDPMETTPPRRSLRDKTWLEAIQGWCYPVMKSWMVWRSTDNSLIWIFIHILFEKSCMQQASWKWEGTWRWNKQRFGYVTSHLNRLSTSSPSRSFIVFIATVRHLQIGLWGVMLVSGCEVRLYPRSEVQEFACESMQLIEIYQQWLLQQEEKCPPFQEFTEVQGWQKAQQQKWEIDQMVLEPWILSSQKGLSNATLISTKRGYTIACKWVIPPVHHLLKWRVTVGHHTGYYSLANLEWVCTVFMLYS